MNLLVFGILSKIVKLLREKRGQKMANEYLQQLCQTSLSQEKINQDLSFIYLVDLYMYVIGGTFSQSRGKKEVLEALENVNQYDQYLFDTVQEVYQKDLHVGRSSDHGVEFDTMHQTTSCDTD